MKKILFFAVLVLLFAAACNGADEEPGLENAAVPEITVQPVGDEVILGEVAAPLSVTAVVEGGGILSYQWFSNSGSSTTGAVAINSATNSTFTPPTDTLGTTFYYVVVTNTDNSVSGVRVQSVTSTIVAVVVVADLDYIVEQDTADLQIDTWLSYFYHEIMLPTTGARGSNITWVSDNANYPIVDGIAAGTKRVRIRDTVTGVFTFNLTATIQKGSASDTKSFEITAQEYEFYGYLMAYFTGDAPAGEQVRFAIGRDGLNFTTLNRNRPVILAEEVASAGGMRDPFIIRSHEGGFLMVNTDMRSSLGWNSNRGIILSRSANLTDWTHSAINIAEKWPAEFGDIYTAWAPEVNFDRRTGRYMIFYSHARVGWTPHRIYFTYANEDFTDLVELPQRLFIHPHGRSTIDGNITNLGGYYHMIYKNEGSQPGIPGPQSRMSLARSRDLHTGWEWVADHVCMETESVEGAQVFRLFGTDTFVLAYDMYSRTAAPAWGVRTSTDLVNWSTRGILGTTGFNPRHGSIIPITQEEFYHLQNYQAWPGILTPPVVTDPAPLTLHFTFNAGDGDTADSITNRANPGTHNGVIMRTASPESGLGIHNGIGTFHTGTDTGTNPGAGQGGTGGGDSPAWIDMGSAAGSLITSQDDFTIASFVYIDQPSNWTGAGRFLWSFSGASHAGGTEPVIWFRATDTQHTISRSGWAGAGNPLGERFVRTGMHLPRQQWIHVMVRQSGEFATIYINGIPEETGVIPHRTTEMGSLTFNRIGRPCFNNDNFVPRTFFADFRIYSGAISEDQIATLDIPATLAILNGN